jgi:HAD superfamily hydrolase (TIGR01509 family)
MTKAILFDLDGVIVDSEPLHHRAFDLALAEDGIPPIPFQIYADQFSSRGVGLEWAARTLGVDAKALQRRKQEIYTELLRREARLCDAVAEVLPRLAGAYVLAVATNSPRAEAAFVLERFALAAHFRALIGREDYAEPKPAPDPFLAATARLGVDRSECVVVEDSFKGLAAARAAGIRCFVVPNEYTRDGDLSEATARLASLRDLEHAIR